MMTKVEELISVVRALPPDAVDELLKQARTLSQKSPTSPPYTPVSLIGLWKGYTFTEAEIRQARKEMWRRFEDEDAE